MTESIAVPQIKRLCKMWADSLFRSLASFGVAAPKVGVSEPVYSEAPSSQEFEKLVCLRFSAGGAIKGELLCVAENSAAVQIAQSMKSGAVGPGAEFSDAHRDAFAEFLRQTLGETSALWKQDLNTEIDFVFQPTAEAAPVTAQCVTLRLMGEKLAELSLRVFFNDDLCAALSSLPAPVEPSATKADDAPATSHLPRTSPLPANLGLVLDVELEATIRFGEREMLLRDIFGLMAGAVVELNQMVNEPAELLVAGRLVARGEVVVVDGNFGLRVTEVASINERVAAIHL